MSHATWASFIKRESVELQTEAVYLKKRKNEKVGELNLQFSGLDENNIYVFYLKTIGTHTRPSQEYSSIYFLNIYTNYCKKKHDG